ncbi:hypothetical protein ACF1BE_31950 [Streptomyces sp. NPDC014991]|uniref:hypothetical protein n=1 Tax=Streptomyces sp. NPDC014991 TaxID=3364935 RepID=UPI0037018F86
MTCQVTALALATDLPEIAITVSAALAGRLDVAVGDILGGLPSSPSSWPSSTPPGVRPRTPLTRFAASLQLVLEGALVVVVLAVAVMGTQPSPDPHAARPAPASVVIAASWVIGLVLLNRARRGLPWREGDDAPDSQPEPRGHSRGKKQKAATDRPPGSATTSSRSATSSAVTRTARPLPPGHTHLRQARPAGRA